MRICWEAATGDGQAGAVRIAVRFTAVPWPAARRIVHGCLGEPIGCHDLTGAVGPTGLALTA
ncbi:hypothetical protein ACFY5F_21610 [Streptomyces sp. NPDC013161]|uniref:hypothetical protein n=1 Tax=Streptomyces sp. NPDC013161 TaxID=3364862 RepID=UPI0036D19656